MARRATRSSVTRRGASKSPGSKSPGSKSPGSKSPGSKSSGSKSSGASGTVRARVVPAAFDPDAAATGDGLFGLTTSVADAGVVVIPVPFDATTSYRAGTAGGPAAVLEASRQVDLEDVQFGAIWRAGVAMLPIPGPIAALSRRARRAAEPVIAAGGTRAGDRAHARAVAAVDAASERVHGFVASEAARILDRGQIPALLGGDHASPFGLIAELSSRHPGMGILQVDAHADLRESFEGFAWSHASIFHNVMTRLPGVKRLVQVGIRDVGARELEFARASKGRVRMFCDQHLRDRQFAGVTWTTVCRDVIAALPRDVYVSFDIDGLAAEHCPSTGTPVPGGLAFPEVCHLLELLSASGRRVIGFDLCEVAPGAPGDEWNGCVGARVLYKLMGCALRSRRAARRG